LNLPRLSVRNPVAVNLLMLAIVLSGFYYWSDLVREFFPNAEAEQVFITVPYPGATPEEVEKSVTRRIEREIENLDDIETIESKIFEGVTVIQVTLEQGADLEGALNDLRSEIDKVKPDLPEGAEDPEIAEVRPTVPVIGVVVFGEVAEERLREAARTVRDDILVGEVWLCSGQSNMAMTVNRCKNPNAEQAAASLPNIRMLTVARVTRDTPSDDCKGTWLVCSPTTVPSFSGTAYFFGRKLHKDLGVPVGPDPGGGGPSHPGRELLDTDPGRYRYLCHAGYWP